MDGADFNIFNPFHRLLLLLLLIIWAVELALTPQICIKWLTQKYTAIALFKRR